MKTRTKFIVFFLFSSLARFCKIIIFWSFFENRKKVPVPALWGAKCGEIITPFTNQQSFSVPSLSRFYQVCTGLRILEFVELKSTCFHHPFQVSLHFTKFDTLANIRENIGKFFICWIKLNCFPS